MKIYENLNLQDLNGEIWKAIEEFPDYSVSNYGRIKSFKQDKINGKIMKQYKDEDNYFKINLFKNGNSQTKQVHRLVYETFEEKLKKGFDVHHINENKEDNFFENLELKPHHKHMKDHHIGKIHSNESKIKMSRKQNGKIRSEETKKRISESKKGKNNPMFNTHLFGENNGNCKLTNNKIIQIKILFKLNFKDKEISKIYNVSQKTISYIRSEKTWSHIKLEI
jgi:hypothetical protein